MVGTRVQPDEKGNLSPGKMPVGSFGRPTNPDLPGFCRRWLVLAPDNSACSISPEVHKVTEHEDGTITLSPSLVTSTWHGWLRRGVFTSV